MVSEVVAGVAGQPQANDFNEGDGFSPAENPAESQGNPGKCPTSYVQIVDAKNERATRFPFESHEEARSFAATISTAFNIHRVDGVVGTYRDGEKCPYGHGSQSDVNHRLTIALIEAGRSALGMPGTVDTLKAMLDKAGLALVLR